MVHFEEERPSLLFPISASLIIHALLLLTFIQLPMRLPKPPEEMIVEVMPSEELKEIQEQNLRIADIEQPDVEKKPDKARFAGMYDSSVPEEVVSSEKGRAASRGSSHQQRIREARETKPKPQKSAEKKDRLMNFDQNLFAMREPSPSDAGEQKPGRQKISISGSGGDYFPDVKVGKNTYLNVLRYPEVGYFVRLKRQFRMTFNPVPVLSDYFSENQVARGSVEVVLGVSVGRSGNLSELFVLRGSGIASYDQEALRTVRASAPFASPPDKFVADDGVLRMMWTFTVYL